MPPVAPPAGTTWVLHQNVLLYDEEPAGVETVTLGDTGGEYIGSGWRFPWGRDPTWSVPGISGNDHYFFERWYFASFALFLDHVETGEIMAVQPGVAGGPSPFSAGQNVVCLPGDAYVFVHPEIGSGPGWPVHQEIWLTRPQWGLHDVGGFVIPLAATPIPGARLLQWRGDVWVAEPASGGPPETGETPIALGATARDSPMAPPFQIHWPQKNILANPAEPGDPLRATWPRMGLDARQLLVYEVAEHWSSTRDQGAPAQQYEREYTLVKYHGQEAIEAEWSAADTLWNTRLWGA